MREKVRLGKKTGKHIIIDTTNIEPLRCIISEYITTRFSVDLYHNLPDDVMHTDCIVPYQFVHFHSAISKPTQFSTEKYYFSVTYSILERLGELALAPTIAHNELKSYN
jgi:hypothetical protein